MSHNDKIYCFACKKITLDIDPIKIQDSRFNPKWKNWCIHCKGFNTMNASQFMEEAKEEITIPIATSVNKKALQQLGEKLVEEGKIHAFVIWKIGKSRFRLYNRERSKRELKKAIKQFNNFISLKNKYMLYYIAYKKSGKTKTLNTINNIVISGNTNMKQKRKYCWYCYSRVYLDKFGCCPKCGTNLKKYPRYEKHPYPDLSKIDREVLGDVVPIEIADANDEQEQW